MPKRKKILSVLLIPEGEKQTYNFKISYFVIKTLVIFSFVFITGLVVGSVSYWKLAEIAIDYSRIQKLNQRLLEKNLIINDIVERFGSIEETDRRLHELFGDNVDFSTPAEVSFNKLSVEDSEYLSLIDGSRYRTFGNGLQGDVLSSFPSFNPVKGQISREFIESEHDLENAHHGIDIAAKELSVIKAAGDGIVLFANWTNDAGYQVVIDHLNGYISFYKHNASLSVKERQFVFQGEPIALLGSSGNSTAPHLHFEIWKDFKPFNPQKILPAQ